MGSRRVIDWPAEKVALKVFTLLESIQKLASKLLRTPTNRELDIFQKGLDRSLSFWFGKTSNALLILGIVPFTTTRDHRIKRATERKVRYIKRDHEEIAAIVTLRYLGGYTLEELGVFCGGVTKQRAQQISKNGGNSSLFHKPRAGWSTSDPLTTMKCLRREKKITSFSQLQKQSGQSYKEFTRMLGELDLTNPIKRLF